MCHLYTTSCSIDLPYLGGTIRYLHLCSIYNIDTVYIGEYPYSEEMLPGYPAAFSHNHLHGVPRTLSELCRYFDEGTDAEMVMNMMANSWSLLPMGIAMAIADYMSRGVAVGEEHRGVRYVGRIDQMSHYISGVILGQPHTEKTINLVGIGETGRSVVREVKSRMSATGRTVIVHEISQTSLGVDERS